MSVSKASSSKRSSSEDRSELAIAGLSKRASYEDLKLRRLSRGKETWSGRSSGGDCVCTARRVSTKNHVQTRLWASSQVIIPDKRNKHAGLGQYDVACIHAYLEEAS